MLPAGPNELTGAYVAALREHLKVSRDAWAGEVGISGGPQWRIEKKNQFKEGERDQTWAVIVARGGPVDLAVSGDVAPTRTRTESDGAPKSPITRRKSSYLPKVDLTTPVHTISPEFVPPVFANDGIGDATDPDDEEDDSPSFVVTTETVELPQQTHVIPLPRGWEHYYPPSDPRHLHHFLRGETSCANRSCTVTTSGASVTEPEDNFAAEAARLLALDGSEISDPTTLDVKVDAGFRPLSNSEAEDARRCWRKWWLNWYLGLHVKDEDMLGPRAVGDRVHRALAGWYVPDGQTRVDPRDGLERAIVEDWTVLNRRANERGMDAEWLATLATSFTKVNSLERAMIEGYCEWIQETGRDSELVITGSEVALAAPIRVLVNGEEVPVEAIGKLDARFTRVSDGRRGFMDHKSVASLKEPLPTLVGNNQMFTYIMLEWLNTPEGELACDTALYNMIRRVKRTASANPPFYDRVEVRHTVPELEFFKAELEEVAAQIVTLTRRLDAGEDPRKVATRSWRPACKDDCDHWRICPLFNDATQNSHVQDALEERYVKTDPLRRYEGLQVVRPALV